MNIMILYISACMIGEPNQCKEFKVQLDEENMNEVSCMMSLPVHFTQFSEEHPGWQIKKWSCRRGQLNGEKKEQGI